MYMYIHRSARPGTAIFWFFPYDVICIYIIYYMYII